ncbi:hypothetical protein AOR_1_1006034 [Paecilomyces variotii No. 5]|uniref:N-acetyltransferase domain-containing protein n=1 Tax=Byssochlamys spectabilis (strain No. 5 / NBRC 109023) TaxID=1356009 RepID=V5G466_BYSSN|nr:hypothetical protein AOR_1_1006034 [Paecilomyces variotii No. 5]
MSEPPLKRLKSAGSDTRSPSSGSLPTTVHLENVPRAQTRPPRIDTTMRSGFPFSQEKIGFQYSPGMRSTSLKTISPQVSPTSIPPPWNEQCASSASSRSLGGRTPSISQSQTPRQQTIQFAEDPFTRTNKRNINFSHPRLHRAISIGTAAPPPRWVLVEDAPAQQDPTTLEERARTRLPGERSVGRQRAASAGPEKQPGTSARWDRELRKLRWQFEPGSPGARGELSESGWQEAAWRKLEEALRDPKTRQELREKINVGPLDNTIYCLEDPLPPMPPDSTFTGAQVRKPSVPESSTSLSTTKESAYYYPDYDRPSLAVQPGSYAAGGGGPAGIARRALDQMRTAISVWTNNNIPRRGSDAAPMISHSSTEERRSKEARRSPQSSRNYLTTDEERQIDMIERDEPEDHQELMGYRPTHNIPRNYPQPTISLDSESGQGMSAVSEPAHGLPDVNYSGHRWEAAEILANLRAGGQQQGHPTTGGKQISDNADHTPQPYGMAKTDQIKPEEEEKHFPKRYPPRRMKIWSGVWLPNEDIDEENFAQLSQVLPSRDRPFNRIKKITVTISTTSDSANPNNAQRGAGATDEDLQAIEAIVRHAYSPYVDRIGREPGPMLDDYRSHISNHHAHVIVQNGIVQGFLVLIPEREAMLLDNVAVAPAAHGKGLGRRLLDFAEQAARKSGCGSIKLYTNEAMTENIALYSRLGYLETHRIEEKGLKRVYMVKRLD